jgi:hypothetical protein
MNRSIQATDNLDERARRSIVAQARRDADSDVRRAVDNGSASNHQIYRDAYDAAFKAGLKVWAGLHGKDAAADAAREERERLDAASGRRSRSAPVRWNKSSG